MELKKLIDRLKVLKIAGSEDVNIETIQSDSRAVKENDMFVAVRGTTVDGHEYIDKALGQGAKVIVCEAMPQNTADLIEKGVTIVSVADSAQALGEMLSEYYGNPSHKLTLVGVTGTNGKTTTATVLYELFHKMGYKAGLLSTVCNYINETPLPTDHTTPDPITLHKLMFEMEEAGCEYVFMEVSSHSIDQRRISGLKFAGGIFTNLTRDHLDYHKTVENYLKAKKKFFDDLPETAFALTNIDDKSGMVMVQNTKAPISTYSMRTLADFKGKILESHFEGTAMLINGREVMTRFVGRFNAYNLLAVYGTAILLGCEPQQILVALSALRPVAGRFQTLHSPKGYTALVDYAHTPDALTNVLNTIHEVLEGTGRVITVVGCGGNRDKGKRPIMAKEAAKLSDQVILTSDNPRFEEPDAIIEDMMAGLSALDMQHTLCITDRKQAIKTATMLAKRGDVILVAGKGHEDYQEIKGVKHHLDDREILNEILSAQVKNG